MVLLRYEAHQLPIGMQVRGVSRSGSFTHQYLGVAIYCRPQAARPLQKNLSTRTWPGCLYRVRALFYPSFFIHHKPSQLLDGVLPGNHSLVVHRERVLRFPRLLVEFQVGHTVGDESECLFVKVQDTARIVGERVVQFLVCSLFVHMISLRTT